MKNNSIRTVTVIVLMLITLAAAGCSTDSDFPYYGKWIFEEMDATLTLSADELVYSNGSGGFTVRPVEWTAITNANPETRDQYPRGYRITGAVYSHNGDSGWTDGQFYGKDCAYFISADEKTLLEQTGNFERVCFYTAEGK